MKGKMHGLNNVHVNKLGISEGDLNHEIWYYTYSISIKPKHDLSQDNLR